MLQQYRLFLIFLYSLSHFSCEMERTIDIELPDYQTQIIAIGYVSPRHTSVFIAPTQAPLDNTEAPPLEGLKVSITNEIETISLIPQVEGLFQTQELLEANTWTLNVLSDNFPPVRSVAQTIPSQPTIENPTWTLIDSTQHKYRIDFEFKKERPLDYYGTLIEKTCCDPFPSTTPFFNKIALVEAVDSIGTFSISSELRINDNATISLRLFHLSPDLFQYIKSIRTQEFISGDYLYDPVSVFSNIENGVGGFGALREDSLHIHF